MAKTLGSLLSTVGTAALVAGAVATGVGAIALPGLAGSLSLFGVSTGTLALAGAGLTYVGGQLSQQSPRAEQTETALKMSIPPRQSGYGVNRLFLAYALYVTAADGTAVDVGAFHEGRVDSIIGQYLGDKKVTLTAGGYVIGLEDGQFGENDDNVLIGTTLGPAVNTAFAPVIAKLPDVWTNDHRGDGVVTGFTLWKAVKAGNYPKVYSGGGPDQMPMSLVMKLQPVFDWRDPTQSLADPLTWKWSENACLHYAHYLLVRDNKTWAKHFAPTLSYWTAAADDCDVAVPLKAGGTEPRYRGCVVHKHTDTHKAVKAALLACFDGWETPRADGALVIYSGRYQVPTVTIGSKDIVSYSIQGGVEEENAVNTIPLTYVSAEHDYTVVDTTPWTDEDDIERRGKELSGDGLANQVPSHAQAGRLGKRVFAEAMAPKRGNCTTLWTGRKMLGQRYVWLELGDLGLTIPVQVKAPVKRDPITGQLSFAWILADPNVDTWNPATEEGNPAPVGNVVAGEPLDTPTIISATAMYSAVGSTPEGDEPIDPTPGQTATGARVLIAATGPDRADLTWYARWRVGTSGSWNEREYADADPGPGVSFQTEFVPLASNLNVEVAYSVGDGRLSDWSDPVVVNTTTG